MFTRDFLEVDKEVCFRGRNLPDECLMEQRATCDWFRDADDGPFDLGRSIMGLCTESLNLEQSLSVRSTAEYEGYVECRL